MDLRCAEQIDKRLEPHRQALLTHPIYSRVRDLGTLRIFMEHHVFAVWDFMSLLKKLQLELCSQTLPWLPPADPGSARLINEIVLGEETDEDGQGKSQSHFELYHRAMRACGASTAPVDEFLGLIRKHVPVEKALLDSRAHAGASEFVSHTFRIIEEGHLCQVASAFTFGREELLPGVFQQVVDELNDVHDGRLDDFKYYLNRHIELDGDEHGPMALQLVARLCGNSDERWELAEQTAVHSLQIRKVLWDSALQAMESAPTQPQLAMDGSD